MGYRERLAGGSVGIVLQIMTILLGLWGVLSSTAAAQSYLYNRADFPTGNQPSAVIAADFNGDGKLDLAVTNQNDNTVSILLGKPDGTFAPHVDYATGLQPVALVAADFNGDGKLDLAVVNNDPNGSGSVSILLGNGDGTFQNHVEYPTGASPIGIVAADFNGDRKPDLAVANNADNAVSILLGNGDGTFQGQSTVAVDKTPVALSAGDFNNDGRLDLITSNSGSSDVTVLLSNGDGTFKRVDSPAGGTPGGIAVGDFNGDRKLDATVALPNSNPSILLGKGDGSFQPFQYINTGPIAGLVVAGDFDNDGKLDLAFLQVNFPSQQFVEVLRGNGDGTFKEISTSTEAASTSSLFVADFNGDGRADLAATAPFYNVVSILLGNGNCSFDSSANSTLSQQFGVGPLVVADFNGDGKPDVAWSIGTVSVLLGDGKGGLGAPTTVTSLSFFASNMVAGDFNGDGKTDLALGGEFENSITLLPGKGDGTFGSPIHTGLASSVSAGQMAAGDLNGDGKTDLIVNAYNGANNQNALTVYFGQGSGAFTAGQILATSVGHELYVAIGDFNHDGKLDVAYADLETSSSGAVYVLLGNGDGTFRSPASFSIGVPNGPPVVSDVNGDGNPDLVVPADVGFSVLLGNGDGTFRNQIYTQVSAGDAPGHVVVADFNDDGKPDVAVDFPFSILLGNGDGTFQSPRLYAAGAGAIGLGSGDFNSDGVADLVLGNPAPTAPASVDLFLSAPFVNLFPTALAFASQDAGAPSAPHKVTLTNIGSVPMTVTSIAPAGDFSETNTCNATIAVADNCTVNVTFTPTATGTRNGALTITDNVVTSPQVISLTGTGVVPVVGLSMSSLTFASQAFATASASQSITLSNTSAGSLNIKSFAFGGANQGDFTQTNTCGASVAAGANCTISVTFTPQGVGARTATLTITDNNNGANNSTQTITITGTGAVATPAITWGAPAAIVYGTPLGAAQLNATSPVQGAFTYNPPAGTIMNAGAQSITATFTPTNAVDYTSATQTVQITVSQAPLVATAANASRNYGSPNPPLTGSVTGLVNNDNITATYSTTATSTSAPGAYPITPALSDPSGRLPNYAVTLNSGTLTVISVALVSLSTPSVDFGNEVVGGTSAVQTVTLKNTGTAALNLASIAASGDFVAGNNCGGSVAANASCAINVTFKPTAGGSRTGTLSVADNAVGGPQTVALEGTGQDFSFGAPSGGSTSASVSRGGTATYTLGVGALGGLNQTISFSCTGAPSESTCAVSPGSVTPGSAATTVTVTVTTTAPSMVAPPAGSVHGDGNWRILVFGLIGLTGLLFLSFGGLVRRRPWAIPLRLRWSLVAVTAVLLCALTMAACGGGSGGGGGGGGNPGTPSGTYTLTVAGTVTSGTATLTHDVSLTLKVQ